MQFRSKLAPPRLLKCHIIYQHKADKNKLLQQKLDASKTIVTAIADSVNSGVQTADPGDFELCSRARTSTKSPGARSCFGKFLT